MNYPKENGTAVYESVPDPRILLQDMVKQLRMVADHDEELYEKTSQAQDVLKVRIAMTQNAIVDIQKVLNVSSPVDVSDPKSTMPAWAREDDR